MKHIALIAFIAHYYVVGSDLVEPDQIWISEVLKKQIVTKDLFEDCKSKLPNDLQNFVTDFAKWSVKDKNCIKIIQLSYFIHNLDPARQVLYNGNLMLWMEKKIEATKSQNCPDLPLVKTRLLTCLRYLQ